MNLMLQNYLQRKAIPDDIHAQKLVNFAQNDTQKNIIKQILDSCQKQNLTLTSQFVEQYFAAEHILINKINKSFSKLQNYIRQIQIISHRDSIQLKYKNGVLSIQFLNVTNIQQHTIHIQNNKINQNYKGTLQQIKILLQINKQTQFRITIHNPKGQSTIIQYRVRQQRWSKIYDQFQIQISKQNILSTEQYQELITKWDGLIIPQNQNLTSLTQQLKQLYSTFQVVIQNKQSQLQFIDNKVKDITSLSNKQILLIKQHQKQTYIAYFFIAYFGFTFLASLYRNMYLDLLICISYYYFKRQIMGEKALFNIKVMFASIGASLLIDVLWVSTFFLKQEFNLQIFKVIKVFTLTCSFVNILIKSIILFLTYPSFKAYINELPR